MNNQSYVEDVLRPFVHVFAQILGSDLTLMHDNARSHTALQAREYLAMETFECCSGLHNRQTSTLSSIQGDMLQKRVLEDLNGVRIIKQLKDLLKFNWEVLPQDNIIHGSYE